MVDDKNGPIGKDQSVAAIDNGAAETTLDTAIVTPARLIARQMARKAFEHPNDANLYHREVRRLSEALRHPRERDEAAAAINELPFQSLVMTNEKLFD